MRWTWAGARRVCMTPGGAPPGEDAARRRRVAEALRVGSRPRPAALEGRTPWQAAGHLPAGGRSSVPGLRRWPAAGSSRTARAPSRSSAAAPSRSEPAAAPTRRVAAGARSWSAGARSWLAGGRTRTAAGAARAGARQPRRGAATPAGRTAGGPRTLAGAGACNHRRGAVARSHPGQPVGSNPGGRREDTPRSRTGPQPQRRRRLRLRLLPRRGRPCRQARSPWPASASDGAEGLG